MTMVSPRKDHRARVPALESSPGRFAVIRDSGQGSLTERQLKRRRIARRLVTERTSWREMDKQGTALNLLIEDFLLVKRSQGCSPRTVAWYRSNLKQFARELEKRGEKPVLASFTAANVRRYIEFLQERRTKYEGNHLRRVTDEAPYYMSRC